MRSFRLTPSDIVARVSDRRILTEYLLSLGVQGEAMDRTYAVIDKLERTPREVSAEKLAALDVPSGGIVAILRIAEATLEDVARAVTGAGAAVVEEFAEYQRYLDALGVGEYVTFDLSIVRGLAYYTGIVFELFDRSGEFRAIAGGGRYDDLLQSLGGTAMPALGFGMGDVVLGELLRSKGLMPPAEQGADVWLAADESVPVERVMREAAARRAAGQAVEYALRPQTLTKQKKAAQASGAREFVTLSNDDGRNG
jgi:histidyl-tRNA synthetase